MRGRPRKPTALKLLEGGRGHRPIKSGEPQYPPLDPTPPRHLSPAARAVWRDYHQRLEPTGVLTEADGPALAELCEDVAMAAELSRGIRSICAEITARSRAEGKPLAGNAQTSFAATTEGRRLGACLRALTSLISARQRDFGMTPGSRSRTGSAGSSSGPLDSIENLIGGK